MVSKKWIGHIATFSAYAIFGFNFVVCKDLFVSPQLSAKGIFFIRIVGAGLLFWLLSLFSAKEKVSRPDMIQIFFASILGFVIPQYTLLSAISRITPMECSLICSLTPIFTMIIAAIALHEPLTGKKIGGVTLSFAGVVYLILSGVSGGIGDINLTGIMLMLVNALSFGAYLGIFRPVIQKYSIITFQKWIFLFATVIASPFGLPDILNAHMASFPTKWVMELGYLIVFATFIAFFLIPLGQKNIRPTLVSMYSYVQPIVAISISICMGFDTISLAKVLATAMVFAGVYIVSQSKSTNIKSYSSLL